MNRIWLKAILASIAINIALFALVFAKVSAATSWWR